MLDLKKWMTKACNTLGVLVNSGAKNILPYPYYYTTRTINGITFTDNGDGSVTANGTATANAQFWLRSRTVDTFLLPSGEYIISDGAGGSSATTRTAVNATVEGANVNLGNTYTDGGRFTIPQTATSLGVYIQIQSGQTVSNLTFYPMIRPAEITDDTWVPYGMGNAELTEKLTKVLNWFASGSNQQILSEAAPPSSATYGSCIRLRGDGLSGTAGAYDTYWLGIDSNGTFYTGTQLNQASSITWQNVPAGVADYIVEIGSLGYWKWVKYNSGEFDMWVTWSGTPDGGTGTHYMTVNGFYGYYSSGYTFPSGCKPVDTNYHIHTDWTIGSGFTMDAGAVTSKTTTGFSVYALSTAGNVTSITVRSHIHGRWK